MKRDTYILLGNIAAKFEEVTHCHDRDMLPDKIVRHCPLVVAGNNNNPKPALCFNLTFYHSMFLRPPVKKFKTQIIE